MCSHLRIVDGDGEGDITALSGSAGPEHGVINFWCTTAKHLRGSRRRRTPSYPNPVGIGDDIGTIENYSGWRAPHGHRYRRWDIDGSAWIRLSPTSTDGLGTSSSIRTD